MSNILTNSLETKSYTLFLSSSDKISGTNNNATFNVNWFSFLPREYDTYKVGFSFQSGGGKYTDTTFTQTVGTSNILNGTLTIAAGSTLSSAVKIGQLLTGTNIASGTYIKGFGTGTGSANSPAGTYTITNNGQNLVAIANLSGSQVFSGCKIQMNLLGRSFSYDSNTQSPSTTIGYAQRDIQTANTNSNSFSAFYLQFPPKTVSRPSNDQITIFLYNLNYPNVLLYDTDSAGTLLTDCTAWNIILEFTPVLSSLNDSKLGKTQF
jgi:hypothetical protein